MNTKDIKYPEGYFLSKWMIIFIAIFSGLGIPLSVITNNSGFIGIGPALGVAIGLSIGQSIENKYKQKGLIRPINEIEKNRKKNSILAGIIILTFGVLIFVVLLFL